MAREFLSTYGSQLQHEVAYVTQSGRQDRHSYCANSELFRDNAGTVSDRQPTAEEFRKLAEYYSK